MLSKTPLHQLVDRTRLEPWRKALLDAADYIDKHGHCKGEAVDKKGRSCLIGALEIVRIMDESATKPVMEIRRYLQSTRSYDVIHWNDAPERTPAEVIGAMRECALKGTM